MFIHPSLEARLEPVIRRQGRLRFWLSLAGFWACAGVVVLLCTATVSRTGIILLMLGCIGSLALLASRLKRQCRRTDWRQLAGSIEAQYPSLEGRLLTAIQLPPANEEELSYLQRRLLAETLRHERDHDWAGCVPLARLRLAQLTHWLAVGFFILALLNVRVAGRHRLLARQNPPGVTVSPGDVVLERGSSLVILARFGGTLPPSVDLVWDEGGRAKRIPLVKSLADPMFGATIPEVVTNSVYRLQYAGQSTRDYKVTVFEYPRLERADADISFPKYTGQPRKHIANTRRLSAVQGSKLDLAFQFNKPVVGARLVAGKNTIIPLQVFSNQPAAALTQFALLASGTYGLQLTDADGRTNQVPAQFVFEALSNRTPEIRLTLPRGDLRPSPLEEVAFEGTVWDDFGVKAFGLGYSVAGAEPKWIELGTNVPGSQKHAFKYLLRLEDLGVQPDQLVSWFAWADDAGPDGRVRRTTGDLFFGEIRPFDEVFREGQGTGGEGQGGQSGGQPGGQSAKLAELQKQIISATWKLEHERATAPSQQNIDSAEPQSSNWPGPSLPPASYSAYREFSFPRTTRAAVAWSGINDSHLMGQVMPQESAADSSSSALPAPARARVTGSGFADDTAVVRDAQAQALRQAQEALRAQRDSRSSGLWRTATDEMERALRRLQAATNSPTELKEALAAEQAAYQALLRLQEHEYQVSRSRNRNQQGGRGQQMQQQLEQLDLTQSENRYETQSEAQRPQESQRREQLQVLNRLQELARRQQDLNDRLKELQTALQEARTPEERDDIQRRLKRLQEEEQQMLSDIDETRQRMDRPENQSSMADERRQLDQTRNEAQRAAEAAGQGAVSQALAAGTRAQEQLQQARDQLRKESSSQFSDELRQMRVQARDLAREQERLQQQTEQQSGSDHKSLSGPPGSEDLSQEFAQQKERLTNLVERATQLSQQAEQPEPLLSKQLYDTVRQFGQDTAKDVKQLQDDLIDRGLMTRSLYDRLKESPESDGAKLLELQSDLVNRQLLKQASQTGERARAGIDKLKSGVERAAQSVIGDDTEALRLAQQELNQLTQQLQRENAQAASAGGGSNYNSGAMRPTAAGANAGGTNPVPQGTLERLARNQNGSPNSGSQNRPAQQGQENRQSGTREGGQTGEATGDSAQAQARAEANQQAGRGGAQRDGRQRGGGRDWAGGADANGGSGANVLDQFLSDGRLHPAGPLTGEDFVQWADGLRDVEEMLEDPALRNQVAQARERARLLRQAFKHDRKKPDWAVVQLQILQPLLEVRDQVADELARRDSRTALVPVDRDPVPDKYSELVRRYYERLGK